MQARKANGCVPPGALVQTPLHRTRRSSFLLHPKWTPTELVDRYSWFLPSARLPPGWHSDGWVRREKETAIASIDLSGAGDRGADFAGGEQSSVGLLARVRLRLWWLRLFLRPILYRSAYTPDLCLCRFGMAVAASPGADVWVQVEIASRSPCGGIPPWQLGEPDAFPGLSPAAPP